MITRFMGCVYVAVNDTSFLNALDHVSIPGHVEYKLISLVNNTLM